MSLALWGHFLIDSNDLYYKIRGNIRKHDQGVMMNSSFTFNYLHKHSAGHWDHQHEQTKCLGGLPVYWYSQSSDPVPSTHHWARARVCLGAQVHGKGDIQGEGDVWAQCSRRKKGQQTGKGGVGMEKASQAEETRQGLPIYGFTVLKCFILICIKIFKSLDKWQIT